MGAPWCPCGSCAVDWVVYIHVTVMFSTHITVLSLTVHGRPLVSIWVLCSRLGCIHPRDGDVFDTHNSIVPNGAWAPPWCPCGSCAVDWVTYIHATVVFFDTRNSLVPNGARGTPWCPCGSSRPLSSRLVCIRPRDGAVLDTRNSLVFSGAWF